MYTLIHYYNKSERAAKVSVAYSENHDLLQPLSETIKRENNDQNYGPSPMMYLPKIFLLLLSSHLVLALVTLDTIRDLTSLTDECRDRITDEGDVIQLPGTLQVHLGSGQEDGGEIEDVSRMSNPSSSSPSL